MNAPLTPGDWEFLSAYLDGQLTEAEKRRAQDLLARRADLRQAFEELRRTRAALRAAPHRRAPRNFTLTPAMARQARSAFHWGWVPSFSFASALAAVLFVLSFIFRLSPLGLPAMAPMAAPAPLAVQSERAAQQKNLAESPTAAPLILWNDPGSASSGAGGGLAAGAPLVDQALAATPETAAQVYASPATPTPTPPLKSAAAPQATTNTAQDNQTSSAAASPILGVAPTEAQGQIVTDAYRQADQPQTVEAAPYAVASPAPASLNWTWVQAGLAGIALVCGLAAFILWWRSRH
jgi:hypothetical protein